MNRKILFRGKRKDNGEFVYGNLFIPDKPDTPTQICIGTNVVRITYDVVPETVGQYTGLTDKNGIKIFNNDIVESRASENKEDWKRWRIVFYDGSYCFERDIPHKRKHNHERNLLCEDEIALYGLTVIGNIYSNPDLLEVSE